ncbi:MAG: alpha/beta hydrolase [Flavobacteriales bacterium]|nr:alpha/beta hydrolase [Flavobacteriales bacterium]
MNTSILYFTHGPTLAYRTYGNGQLTVLAFHGFGRTGADFAVLEQELGHRCTIHAFDLHFHGNSPGYPERAEKPFTIVELATYFTAFLDQLGVQKTALLGYSLGGRITLGLVEQMPERLERVFLAAPDGLITRPWYRRLATSGLGRALYRRFVERPAFIHGLIHGLRALRLMNEKMHRFLIGQTDSKAKRMLVRDVWLSYRLIEPDLKQVADEVRTHHIPIHLFFGERDTVIKPAFGANLRQQASELITQQELPFGHVLLTPELGQAMHEHL